MRCGHCRTAGFRVVVSSKFADIFRGNAGQSGLLTAQVAQDVVDRMWTIVEADPSTEVTVDLEARELHSRDFVSSFEVDDYTRWRLLQGLDDVGLTLRHIEKIEEYEARRPAYLPRTVA